MGFPVTRLDEHGIVVDSKPYTLPPNAWSDGRNVRFIDGSVYPTFGHTAIGGTPTVSPHYLHLTMDVAHSPLMAYCGLTKIYATDGVTHEDITRLSGDYTGTVDDLWSAVEFGGISVFNNGIDVPQSWSARQLSQPLDDLPNWPANTTAKLVRSFRRFLFAFDVTKAGVRYPQLAKWSSQADPGSVPGTWDETDTTKEAGEYPLIDTGGQVMEALPLSDIFMIYKTDAVYLARFIGGTFVFDLPLQFRDLGILSQRAVGEWQKRHVVLSNDSNLFMCDGFKYEPILERRYRRWLATRIDSTNAFRSFVTINHAENEAWVCFPESGATYPTVALIVNLKTGAAVPRDLPEGIPHIEYNKPISGEGTTFDSQTTPFDEMVGYFGQTTAAQTRKVLVGVTPSTDSAPTGHIFLYDSGLTFNGTAYESYIERTGFPISGRNIDGSFRVDPTANMFFQELWPKLEMQTGTSVNIEVGGSDLPESAISWAAAYAFQPGSELFIPVDREARYGSIRFSSNGAMWRLTEYDIVSTKIGTF